MATTDFRAQRLFVPGPLSAGARIEASADQAHYLVNVLRLTEGAGLLVFDGSNGEWMARLARTGKRAVAFEIGERVRAQTAGPDLWLMFAPLKQARLDYMIQKAVEMGASRLVPVVTQHTQVTRIGIDRMRANTVEAAEQCGVLTVPGCAEPTPLADALAAFPADRLLIFCDEDAAVANPFDALLEAAGRAALAAPLDSGLQEVRKMAVLIGPEGGFSEKERETVRIMRQTAMISLGPRILRADTAAVAALAVVQAALGDWGR